MLKRLLIGLVTFSAIASATAVADNQAKIDSTVEKLESQKGIDIGGTVRAVYNKSNIDIDQDVDAYNRLPDREISEFVQLDLDMHFRPWDFVRANLLMRLGAGMQDYFANSATMVNVQWANVEGEIGKNFHWVVGDFRQQYSPLTLFMPGVDIMYEPMIFARNREMGEREAMIQGNQRNMQGVNLQFRKDMGATLGELRVEGIFARLRRAARLDLTGAEGNLIPGEGIYGASQAGTFDKYAVIGNIEMFPLNKNLMVGVTALDIFDDENSKAYTYYDNDAYTGDDAAYALKRYPMNYKDSLPQDTKVGAVRLGADVAGIMSNKNMILDVTGEFAMSMDKVYTESATYIDSLQPAYDEMGYEVTDESGAPVMEMSPLLRDSRGVVYDTMKAIGSADEVENGMAFLANLNAGYRTDKWMVNVAVDYVHNDSAWFNPLAQSPSFIANRIMNSDKDGDLTRYKTYAPLYSTFDALYFFTPKHSPVSKTLTNDDAGMEKGQTKSYNIAPYSKTSYTTATLTRKELALVEELSDASLQMALPNGLATSNRNGFRVNLTAGLGKDNMVEVQGLFTKMDQIKGIGLLDKASFTEYGAGGKVDILALLGFNLPLELSGSYKHAERSISDAEFKTDFINVGLYARYWKRLGVSVGAQRIDAELNPQGALLQQAMMGNLKATIAPIMKGKQIQWMAGLDYTLAPHAWLALNYGQASVSNSYAVDGLLGGKYNSKTNAFVADTETNLPDYMAASSRESTASRLRHKFVRDIVQATVNVEF